MQVGSNGAVDGAAERGECVEAGLGEYMEMLLYAGEGGEAIGCREGFEVEDMFTDCDGGTLFGLGVFGGYNAEGEVGEGEMAV